MKITLILLLSLMICIPAGYAKSVVIKTTQCTTTQEVEVNNFNKYTNSFDLCGTKEVTTCHEEDN